MLQLRCCATAGSAGLTKAGLSLRRFITIRQLPSARQSMQTGLRRMAATGSSEGASANSGDAVPDILAQPVPYDELFTEVQTLRKMLKNQELVKEVQELRERNQALEKELSNEKRKFEELKRKIEESGGGGCAVVQFEDGCMYDLNEYATEKDAVASFSRKLEDCDLDEEPRIESGKSYVYVREDFDGELAAMWGV